MTSEDENTLRRFLNDSLTGGRIPNGTPITPEVFDFAVEEGPENVDNQA